MTQALVLSGGGMFGAWQAGVWRALCGRFQPDLVVGASVGALNGWAIAGGADGQELASLWRRGGLAIRNLPEMTRALMEHYPSKIEFAAVATDLMRLKPRIFRSSAMTWRHLAASCAIPGLVRQYRIESRWYGDGGLLNPLPVWAAVELGASRIVAAHALPEIPARWAKPIVNGFRRVAGYHPAVPAGVELVAIETPAPLGSIHDALYWKAANIERWLEEGYECGLAVKLDDGWGPRHED